MSENTQLILAFSIIVASLIISGSVFFAVGSLNTTLSGLSTLQAAPTPTQQQPIQQPTQQQPEPQPQANLSMQDLLKNASFTEGSQNAPIVVVEFSDFQCPFCRRAYNDAIKQLRTEYVGTGKVLFAYADFPLSFHPLAEPSANYVRCAGEQGKARELHDAIFELQEKLGQGTVQYSVDDIKKAAQNIGLNVSSLESCVSSGKYTQAIQDSFNNGAAAGVSGTPSFFVGPANGNGQLLVGAQPYSTFKAAIDALG